MDAFTPQIAATAEQVVAKLKQSVATRRDAAPFKPGDIVDIAPNSISPDAAFHGVAVVEWANEGGAHIRTITSSGAEMPHWIGLHALTKRAAQ